MPYERDELEPYESGEDAPTEVISDRSRGVAMALGLFGGVLGLHRFYTGKVQTGVWMILTFGGLGIWWLYDIVLLAVGEFRDVDGRRVRRWHVEDTLVDSGRAGRRLERLTAQVGQLERDVAELAERLDFAERMLAQHRDRDRLSRG